MKWHLRMCIGKSCDEEKIYISSTSNQDQMREQDTKPSIVPRIHAGEGKGGEYMQPPEMSTLDFPNVDLIT